MILTKLSATNFMKFRELELDDLPRAGLIGILGENEAGKSTIGHAICFALFGCTARPGPEHLASLIRWGADFAEVELCFDLAGRGSFRIFREIDRLGEHLAQLEDLARNRAVCGTYRVARELSQLLGYSLADFRGSAYLGQGELDHPRAGGDLADAIDRLSGVARIHRAIALAEEHSHELRRVHAEVGHALARERETAGGSAGAWDEEAALLAVIADHEAELAAARDTLAEREVRVARVRDLPRRRAELARGLSQVVALAEARIHAAAIGPLAARVRACIAALPEARTLAAVRTLTAREKQERSDVFRDALASFTARVVARQSDLDRMLDPVRTGSVVDERLCAAAEAAYLATRGRTTLGIALAAMALGGIGIILTGLRLLSLQLPPLASMGVARHLPDYIPYVDGLLVAAGLLLAPIGLWQRRAGRRAAARRWLEVSEFDERIEELEYEQALLRRETPIELLSGETFRAVEDDVLRELADRLRREHGDEIARESAGQSGEEPGATAVEREAERLRELGQMAERLRQGLEHMAAYSEFLHRIGVAGAGTDLRADAGAPGEMHEMPPAGAPDSEARALAAELDELESESASVCRRLGFEPTDAGDAVDASDVPALAARVLGEESLAETPLTLTERVSALERLGGDLSQEPAFRATLDELNALASAADGDDLHGETAAGETASSLARTALGAEAALPPAEKLAAMVHDAVTERDGAAKRISELETQLGAARAEFARREAEFTERRRTNHKIEELESRREDLESDIDRERLASHLLSGAAQQLSSRVVPYLARAIGRALDRITGGRYSRAEIGRGARVRVYSDEKNAFVDPVELSSGTQAQIELAQRLGFAEVMLLAKGLRGSHFLFLDEPLGGFDRERSTGFIGLLREFTPVFPQIFVAAGDTALTAVFEHVVRVDGAARELHVRGPVAVEAHRHQPQS